MQNTQQTLYKGLLNKFIHVALLPPTHKPILSYPLSSIHPNSFIKPTLTSPQKLFVLWNTYIVITIFC